MKKLSASLSDFPKVTQWLKTKQNSEPNLMALGHHLAVMFAPTDTFHLSVQTSGMER